jgi:hypothetical protein
MADVIIVRIAFDEDEFIHVFKEIAKVYDWDYSVVDECVTIEDDDKG